MELVYMFELMNVEILSWVGLPSSVFDVPFLTKTMVGNPCTLYCFIKACVSADGGLAVQSTSVKTRVFPFTEVPFIFPLAASHSGLAFWQCGHQSAEKNRIVAVLEAEAEADAV